MRPVRIPPGCTPPQDWIVEAEALTEQLMNAPDDKTRLALIWTNRKLWRDKRIIEWLTGLHHRKCWYTEARESVSAYHVDHFRPKGRAVQPDGEKRTGYWWLTFDWRNYRLSGQLLNVKKRDLFPVKHPSIAQAAVPETLDIEGYRLIDPLTDEAWSISFERTDDGMCLAGPCPGVEGDDLERVKLTIEVLGLNRLHALNMNRAGIWDRCLDRIRDWQNAGAEPVPIVRSALQRVAAQALADLTSEKAEFSSVAKACIEKQAPQRLQRQVVGLLLEQAAGLRTAA